MKRINFLFMCCFVLVACNSHTIIDWVDFIKLDGKEYHAIHAGIIADPKYIGEKVGEVKFKVDENITSPSYQTKNGDAAFLEKGTRLFAIKDKPEFIAAKDSDEINGYRVYHSDNSDFNSSYKDMDKERISKIEIYEDYKKPHLLRTLSDSKQIKDFIYLLDRSETNRSFSPDTSSGDPIVYHMVFYSNQPIASVYQLHYDGTEWYWHPSDTSILSDEIEQYINK